MIVTGTPRLRLRGSGTRLRLRVAARKDPLATVRECCRASTALEKALGEAVRDSRAAGHSWAEVGEALGVRATTPDEVLAAYLTTSQWMRSRFWGFDEGVAS